MLMQHMTLDMRVGEGPLGTVPCSSPMMSETPQGKVGSTGWVGPIFQALHCSPTRELAGALFQVPLTPAISLHPSKVLFLPLTSFSM